MRYIVLNIAVLAALGMYVARTNSQDPISSELRQTMFITSLCLLALTIIFDPLIIHANIVAYNQQHILGLKIFGAPVEDLAYAVAAGVLLPLLWRKHE